nr:DUF6089 family protein [uncultured Carboxylicivirga sp.]
MAGVKKRLVKIFNTRVYFCLLFRKFFAVTLLMAVFFFGTHNIHAQDRLELGGFIGTSYYFGDLNPSRQFYKLQPALGGIGRYAYSDRLAFKASATIGRISGDYSDESLNFKDLRPSDQQVGRPTYEFNNTIGDLTVQAEFNFLSYDHKYIANTGFTPYLSVGLGTMIYSRKEGDAENLTTKPTFILSLPFGVGVKYKVNKWVRLGAEWSFRKTFADDLDYEGPGEIDPSDPYGAGTTWTHNNDWVSFAGVYVTISMLRRKSSCNGGY